MAMVRFSLMLFLMASVLACSNIKHDVEQSRTLTQCKKTCQIKRAACFDICDDGCKPCEFAADKRAERHYQAFKREQCVRGGTITRELQSYRDQLQCRKTSCNCQDDYQVCVQSCHGVIRKRLKIPPVCC